MITGNRKSKHKLLTITVFILVVSTIEHSFVSGNYNIEEGDTFTFEILKVNRTNGLPYAIQFRDITFVANVNMTLKFTLVNPPYFKFKLTINGKTEETALLANIVLQNRSWDKLSTYYSSEFGYDIYEDNDIWGIRLNTTTKLHIDYLKKDGVLTYFYAFNESLLVSELDAGEIEIKRTYVEANNNWAYSFIAVLPIGGLIYGLIIYKRRINQKIAERSINSAE